MNGEIKPPASTDAIDEAINSLPGYVQDEMASVENAQKNGAIAIKYSLNEEQAAKMIKLIGYTILKISPLVNLTSLLASNLNVDQERARIIALDIALQRLLILRRHLPEIESFIKNLGGQLPESPPSLPIKEETLLPPAATIPETDIIIQKDIDAAVDGKPEVANQTITEKPLKLSDSESLKLPSIKNWLADWHQYKSYFTEQDIALVRMKYLHESPNGKNLSNKERTIVNSLLKSADERISLPFSQKTGLLLIEKLSQSSPALPKTQPSPPLLSQPQPAKAFAPPVAPPPATTAPKPPAIPPKPVSQPPSQLPIQPSPPPQSQSTYREPVSPSDLTGPQSSQRPAPKLNGNVIDLKNINNRYGTDE